MSDETVGEHFGFEPPPLDIDGTDRRFLQVQLKRERNAVRAELRRARELLPN